MGDKSENVLVEFDYNNITIIDPNKVIDVNGNVKDRYVKQEDLVMYANLECKVLPRTKLAVGVSTNTTIETISIASINFLKPGDKVKLDNSYTDEITGKDSLSSKGVNQPNKERVSNPKNSNDFYIKQILKSNGKTGAVDNGLLGITSINIRNGLDFLPTYTIELEDVKGRALFEGGDNSPYAAFFNLPYPLFYLTIKGYYGKAVRMGLMLQNFTSRYDSGNGNFKITLTFYTYKYSVLSEVPMAALVATPHMYKSRVKVKKTSGGSNKLTEVEDNIVEIGYQKVREMYSEYKTKGLIPDDFPEITLVQMQNRIENFIKNILDSFTKQNLDPLTDLENYQTKLNEYQGDVYLFQKMSWFDRFMDKTNFFVLKDDKGIVYTFKPELDTKKKSDAITELRDKIIDKYNTELNSNKTVGINGSYTINGQSTKISITNSITYNVFIPKNFTNNNVNLTETYRQRKGIKGEPSTIDLKAFESELQLQGIFNTQTSLNSDGSQNPINQYFIFEGPGTFIDLTSKMGKDLKGYREEIQNKLTDALSELLQSKESGIGFIPNLRNVLAVIFANGEAFLRLMDDVHTKAWNVRDDKYRKEAIFNTQVASANPDNISSGNNETSPVYPWPQMIVETSGVNGHEKYEIQYPGDSKVINQTKAYLPSLWPEVEFVEEFIIGYTERTLPPADSTAESNEATDILRLSLDAIEFPISNSVYSNKEEVKFFYEIFERIFLTSHYSRINRSNGTRESDGISNAVADSENINLNKSLSNDNPFLIEKLTKYGFNSNNYIPFLQHISNGGTGESWQNFIRGIYNTPYIKNIVTNGSFEILSGDIIKQSVSQPLVSLPNESVVNNYISNSTTSNKYDFADTYPFTNYGWSKTYLANGGNLLSQTDGFNTTKVLTYNVNKKAISNFKDTDSDDVKRPITNFVYKDIKTPSYNDIRNLKTFYFERIYNTNANKSYNKQLPTEGNLSYYNYSGLVSSEQTVSMLNTPYFVNAIQEGVSKYQSGSDYPYVSAAYLFLNSLPLSTIREKYKTYNSDKSVTDLDYIFATFKKFGAIHKLPYTWILKMGSIWHRYKTYVETNVDIIDSSWSGFSYVNNYDPITNSPTKYYSLITDNGSIDIVLQQDAVVLGNTATTINTGFYPKLINDFNVFYRGFELFTGYTNSDIQTAISSGLTLTYVPEATITGSKGFDTNNPNRTLKVISWSVFVNTFDNQFSYILPSQGSLINQTKYECITNDDKLKIEVNSNQSMYDGSVRSFWVAPNYGYFDSGRVVKPSPSQYLKQVFSGKTDNQENFSIKAEDDYTSISELFSVFEKDVLDKFESEFLNFSKSAYDVKNEGIVDNFQGLMRSMMKIPKVSGLNTELVSNIQNNQITNIQQVITNFLEYDKVLKYGNPSNFDKKLFYTFSNLEIVEPYGWSFYTSATPDALPYNGGLITLANSKLNYPDEWKTLETYVGFSEIPELRYKDSGSYITDFFIDLNIAFNNENIVNFAPIIKIYATQKLLDNKMNYNLFFTLMTDYLNSVDNFQSKIINNLFIKLPTSFKDITTSSQQGINFSTLEGPQTRVDLWESFKALNDKWISGMDFKTKTLFEDVLLLDRASRNIGDKILVDVFKLKNTLIKIGNNPKISMLSFVQDIITENNFVVMNIPSYVNFYNVQDAVKNPIPKPEGSLEFANTMFGNFLNVDYTQSSAKMVCFYGGKGSEQLAINDNVDYRFKSDAFDLRRASDNPLSEDLIGKTDWDKSNKVVGFNVDIGPQNQSIFYGFQVSQNPGQATAESLSVINQMANQYGNRGSSTQSLSLYNLYKNRSYTCTVSMMGNAMIQPTMYFNLRYVPMFYGPYMITTVNHSITPGGFETIFEGIRQPTASLPKVDNYLQSLKTNLLQTIISKDKEAKDILNKNKSNNVNNEKLKVEANANAGKKLVQGQECKPNVKYEKFVNETPIERSFSVQEVKKEIMSQLISSGIGDDGKLKYAVFAALYLGSGTDKGFIAYDYNFAGVDISQDWGPTSSYFNGNKQYFCLSSQSYILPYAVFDDLSNSIRFLLERWKGRVNKSITEVNKTTITKFWILNFKSEIQQENVYTTYDPTQLSNIESKVQTSIDLFNGSK
jgi:hypothetical protein